MKNYTVYKRTNIVNNKVYIGQTTQTIDQRWSNGKGYKGSAKFNSAIEKYGIKNFRHEVLKENLTHEEADYWEDYYINLYDSINNGYNLKSGGGHCTYSEESKLKMSKNHADVSGANNPMFGKHHTDEARKKMSENRHDKIGSESPFAKRVRCIETGEIFGCLKDAAEWAGLKGHSAISMCINGKRKHAGKHPVTQESLSWEYYTEN